MKCRRPRLKATPTTGRGDGRYRGMWFDNSGMFRPLDARRDGDALVSKWGTPDTEEGETTYRLRHDGTMEVIDRVKSKDGTWRVFGQSGIDEAVEHADDAVGLGHRRRAKTPPCPGADQLDLTERAWRLPGS